MTEQMNAPQPNSSKGPITNDACMCLSLINLQLHFQYSGTSLISLERDLDHITRGHSNLTTSQQQHVLAMASGLIFSFYNSPEISSL